MKFNIKLPASIVENSINLALSKPTETRGNFFQEIRAAFKKNLEEIFVANGLAVNSKETLGRTDYTKNGRLAYLTPLTGDKGSPVGAFDLFFCTKYGHDDYSLEATNYRHSEVASLPSLSALVQLCSIGNILILVENRDCEVVLSLEDGIQATGYAYHISKRRRKSYFGLFGVWFKTELVNEIVGSKLAAYQECIDDLDEIRLGVISYPMIYINRMTGSLKTCSCFKNHFSIQYDIERLLRNCEGELRNKAREIEAVAGLCHLCNGGKPKLKYGNPMYYTSFLQSYLPYQNLFLRMKDGREEKDPRQVENELRERFGYPKIGERWGSETTLYNIICSLFSEFEIVRHYRGKELKGLELDIWIPQLAIGIEYQGEQHYKALPHWGGREGLEKRMVNDQKKKEICKELGYHLIEFKHTDKLTEKLVKARIEKHIN